MYHLLIRIACILGLFLPLFNYADINPEGLNLNYAQKAFSSIGNPASAALVIQRDDPNTVKGGYISIGAGVEFGDLDEIFNKINEFSDKIPPPSNPDAPQEPPEIENPDRNYTWEDILAKYPDLDDRLDIIKDRVVTSAALLALISAEGYAKAAANSHASFILNEDLYGGTLLLGATFKGNAKALGIAEALNFDAEFAKEQLKTLPSYDESDPIQDIDLSSGIVLHYDPSHQNTSLSMSNDSILLVKSTKIASFSFSYSHIVSSFELGDLYWGVEPNFYRVGLTNVTARLGDITDSEELFNDIKDADYIYKNNFDFDFGLVFAAQNYQLGVTFNNVIEQTYSFPEIDRRRYNSNFVLKKLDQHAKFTMERQATIEAGIYSDDRAWNLHLEVDANAISDQMEDKSQWLSITGNYASERYWLPDLRLGFSKNLAGSNLSYVNAGFTLIKFLSLDVSSTLDTVRLDDQNIRRGLHVQLGVQFPY
ncbi:MAG: conjugal transfer protein TraF [Colwellia sp.]